MYKPIDKSQHSFLDLTQLTSIALSVFVTNLFKIQKQYFVFFCICSNFGTDMGAGILLSNNMIIKEENEEKQEKASLLVSDEYGLEKDTPFFRGESEMYTLSGYV